MRTSDLTITEAARAAGVARSTIVRALDAGRFPNAAKVNAPGGPRWSIPVGDLLDAGYAVTVADDGTPTVRPSGAATSEGVGQALERLTGDLLPLLERLANAEREAVEARARLDVEVERHAQALERARFRGRRTDLATYAGLALLAYAGLLAVVEVPASIAAALPAVAGASLASWAAWAGRQGR